MKALELSRDAISRMEKSFWSLIQWISRITALSKIAVFVLSGGLITAAAATFSYVSNHPLRATALGTIAAISLPIAAILYCVTPRPGSYYPRYYAWYRHPLRKVLWRPGGVQLHHVKDGRIIIGEFHCSFFVNRGRIVPKRFSLEFDSQPHPLPVLMQVQHQYVGCEKIAYVPRGSWIHCRARILKNTQRPDDGVTNHPSVGEFYSLFGPFDLIFEAEGYSFIHRFSRYELEMMIRGQEIVLHPPAPISPKLKDTAATRSEASLAREKGTASTLINTYWMLHFNPRHLNGTKEITFKTDGTIGKGRNSNEHTWLVEGGFLDIVRENGDLQNRFQYDPESNAFLCTNVPHAKGVKDQVIRPINRCV